MWTLFLKLLVWTSNAIFSIDHDDICLLSFDDVSEIRDNKAMKIKRMVLVFSVFFSLLKKTDV